MILPYLDPRYRYIHVRQIYPCAANLSILGILCFFLIKRFNALKWERIADIAFELFEMHCGIGRGIRENKIPQEKLVMLNKQITSLESTHQPECISFFLKAISFVAVNTNLSLFIFLYFRFYESWKTTYLFNRNISGALHKMLCH